MKSNEFKFYVPHSIENEMLSKGFKLRHELASSSSPRTTHVRKQPPPVATDVILSQQQSGLTIQLVSSKVYSLECVKMSPLRRRRKNQAASIILIRKHLKNSSSLSAKDFAENVIGSSSTNCSIRCRKNTGISTGFIDVFLQLMEFELRQHGRFMQFQEEKKQLKDEHKMCAEEVSYIAKHRLARKMQERARRTTFNDLNLHGSIQMAVENRNKKKLKERGEHAREILHRMEEEKKLKRSIAMERINETRRVLQTARRLMGKKQIDVAFTDGVVGQASNDKIVNLGFTDGCISDHCRPFNRKSQFVAHFTDGV